MANAGDRGRAIERFVLAAGTALLDGGREHGGIRIEKWDLDQINWVRDRNRRDLLFDPAKEPTKEWFRHFGVAPESVYEAECVNQITKAGWTLALDTGAWLGTAGTLFSATVGRVGLGVGTSACTYGDTALQSITGMAGNNWILCGSAPTYTAAVAADTAPTGGATMAFTATFGTSVTSTSNVSEFAIDQGTASAASTASTAPMVNHSTSISAGTKTSASTWNVTATLTFT